MMRRIKLSLAAAGCVAVVIALAVAHQGVVAAGGTAVVSKQSALDNIARQVILPAYHDLVARCSDFAAAADVLTSAPGAASLKNTQDAWKDMLLAWRRTQPYVHGPIADLGVDGRIQFWPSRRQSVDRVLRAPRPIDDAYIQELGANAVGLSALEIMLFDTRQDEAARLASFSGPQGERQRKYFLALARELVRQTRLVESAWQGGRGRVVRNIAAGSARAASRSPGDVLGRRRDRPRRLPRPLETADGASRRRAVSEGDRRGAGHRRSARTGRRPARGGDHARA